MADEADKTAAELEAMRESIRKLEAKNKELLDEKRKAKEAAEAAEAAREEAEAEKAKAAGDLATLEKSIAAKFEKQLAKLSQERDSLASQLNTVVVDNGLTQALVKANVAPHYQDAVAALIRAKHKIEIQDGAAIVDGKPLTDFVTDFAKSDTGKHYVAAPNNQGGGATGSLGMSGTPQFTKDNFNMTAFGQLAKSNPAEAARVAHECGRPELAPSV